MLILFRSYGDHYWMVDMDMNCTQTFDGWFEVKAYMNDAETWEEDVNQVRIKLYQRSNRIKLMS